jgi:hypothetical protein
LIPSLPESRFAPWQLKRLPAALEASRLLSQGISRDHDGNEYGAMVRRYDEPAATVTGNTNQGSIRGFILGGQFGKPANDSGEPRPAQLAGDNAPAFTVTAGNKGDWRAFLVAGTNANGLTINEEGDPASTVVASAHSKSAMPRAFLMPGQNAGQLSTTPLRSAGEPSPTITNASKGMARAWLSAGRVVKMTPRCLARFQTFPDWYELPESSTLACKGIGNAVPPLLYEKLVKPLLGEP